jgi:hypothetical protein
MKKFSWVCIKSTRLKDESNTHIIGRFVTLDIECLWSCHKKTKNKHKPKNRRYMEIHIPLLHILVDGTQKEGFEGQCLRN